MMRRAEKVGGLAAVVVVVLVGDQNEIEAGADVAATTMATSLSRPYSQSRVARLNQKYMEVAGEPKRTQVENLRRL